MPSIPPFAYSALPPGPFITRMIRLLPDKDKSAQIQCKLLNYNLSDLDGEEHLYEALSYVWGTLLEFRPIMLDDRLFHVTENLHAALLRLRNSQVERTLWIDAVSINQKDDDEKSNQIPLMRIIYAQARQVIVWLGEAEEYGYEALNVISYLGKIRNPRPTSAKDYEMCEKLLQRDWFRRIWVLQEVGVARYISITCGSAQINGHFFCKGLRHLMSFPALLAKINPVTFLMKGAVFRPDHASQEGLSIGELVCMYRNHNATIPHDKVYALLGLSADTDRTAFVPNYELAWHEVLKQFASYVFPKCSVETWFGTEIAVIKGKGQVLGYIHSIGDLSKNSQQRFKVLFNRTCRMLGYRDKWKTEWSLQASRQLIQNGDIICLLEGMPEPSILRLHADHYMVVTPVVIPNEQDEDDDDSDSDSDNEDGDDDVVGRGLPTYNFCDILLVWKVSLTSEENNSQSLSKLIDVAPNYHEEQFEIERRLNHTRCVMVDVAIEEIKKTNSFDMDLLRSIIYNGRIKDVHTGHRRPVSDRVPKSIRAAVKQALWQQNKLLYTWDTVLAAAVLDSGSCGYIISSILLQYPGERVPVSEEVARAAAANAGSYGPGIMQNLIDHCGDSLPVSEEVVRAAAANDGFGAIIMKKLMNYCGNSLPVSEDVVKKAAGNKPEILQKLIDHCGDNLPISEDVVKAVVTITGPYVPEVLQKLIEYSGKSLPISKEVMKATTGNIGLYADDILHILLNYYGNSLPVSEDVVKAIAANIGSCGPAIMQELIDRYHINLPVSEEVVKIAAANIGSDGSDVMHVLMDCYGDILPMSEEVVKAAAANIGPCGLETMQMLKEHYGDSLPVSEEVVMMAAANAGHNAFKVMQMLIGHYGISLHFTVSEDVVNAAAANAGPCGLEIMEILINHCDNSLPVSEEAIKSAIRNEGTSGPAILETLLDYYDDSLLVSDEVVKTAAAGTGFYGRWIMKILIDYYGDSLPVTEAVMKVAAANAGLCGPDILKMLKNHCGDNMPAPN